MIWRWILFHVIGPIFTIVAERHAHDGEGPDVDPVTGDEAETQI
jgi:hypothetical protein